MKYTAQNIKDNAWLVTEIDDNGNNVKKHNVFCKESANTEEDAISLIRDIIDVEEE